MSIGTPELLVILLSGLLFFLPLALGIWTALDASRYPEQAFERAGTNKTLWIVLPIVGIVACGIVTIVSAIVWFSSYKSRVAAAAAPGGTIGQ